MKLQDFFKLNIESRDLRRDIVNSYFKNEDISSFSKPLSKIYDALKSINKKDNRYTLLTDDNKLLVTDLNYELDELHKDIVFCKNNYKGLFREIKKKIKGFDAEVASTISFLQQIEKYHFITDRDGTINNYCGRYQSSIQPAYNAIALTKFARNKTQSSTILTSAPLQRTGILDVSTSPNDDYIIAGSKGREILYKNDIYKLPINADQETVLNSLNQKVQSLTENSKYKKFTLIGSGLQFKYGQTTIARQDISNAIPKQESLDLLIEIEKIIDEVDPEHKNLRIEDTGKDIEIMLTVSGDKDQLKDFDKGDGVEFINTTLKMHYETGNCLVCGDTHSDIAMVQKLQSINKNVFTIFVTQNKELIKALPSIVESEKLHIVSTPDILITAMEKIS